MCIRDRCVSVAIVVPLLAAVPPRSLRIARRPPPWLLVSRQSLYFLRALCLDLRHDACLGKLITVSSSQKPSSKNYSSEWALDLSYIRVQDNYVKHRAKLNRKREVIGLYLRISGTSGLRCRTLVPCMCWHVYTHVIWGTRKYFATQK